MKAHAEHACGWVLAALVVGGSATYSQGGEREKPFEADQAYIKEHYTKYEYEIPMRDGVKLFTAVYAPKDESTPYPILLKRTPYGLKPYGANNYPASPRGPMRFYAEERFIFAYQDVRGKFRNSFENPAAFQPGRMTRVEYTMPGAYHTFRRGHRIMIQLQSSWFPLIDRNPQKFVDIYRARPEDFQKATQRVYRSRSAPSHVKVTVLE